MSHFNTRSSRLLVVAAAVLVWLIGVVPPAVATPDDPPSVVPFIGSAELGCTRGSGGPVCFGHHDYDALDFLMPSGTPLVSPVDGFVTAASTQCGNHPSGCGNGYGNWVQISAADQSRNYLLAHMSEVFIAEGPVEAGEVVGLSGNSGASSTPHLHYEERTFSLEKLKGDQVQPGSMLACLSESFGWDYAADEHWYDLRSHAGVIITSNGADCFANQERARVLDRQGLELAGVVPGDEADRPADWAVSVTDWLGERPLADGGNRLAPVARYYWSEPQDEAIDFSTVWSIPPLR